MTQRNIADKQFYSYVETSKGLSPSYAQRVTFGDGGSVDAFARLRTSVPTVVFDSAESITSRQDRWNSAISGGGAITYVADNASHQFIVGATAGDSARRSSKRMNIYVPGTSILVLTTGVMGAGATNQKRRIGYYNTNNGIFFELSGTSMGLVKRSKTSGTAVDTRVEQEDWNIDTMDGNGPSEIDLDFTNAQIYMMDLEWLGVGRVRCGFVYEGKIIYCHEFDHGNELTTVYMSTANLPVTYEVVNTGASSASNDFRQICSSVIIEGERSKSADHRAVDNGIIPVPITSVVAPVISLRLQTAYVGAAAIKPTEINCLSIGSKDVLWKVLYNATLAGDSWTTNSGIGAFDVAATAVTGGKCLASWYGSSDAREAIKAFAEQDQIGGTIAGVPDTLTLAAANLTGVTSGNVIGSIAYDEIY
jgi:hypothetical protein